MMKSSNLKNKNLAVVGAGPIGLYLSIQLASQGYQVTLFEKNSLPKDKVCGQGIMPSGSNKLIYLLSDSLLQDAKKIEGITYIDQKIKLSGKFEKNALSIKRVTLSELLYKKIQSFDNIILKTNKKIESINDLKQFDTIFACDGMNSPIRKELNLNRNRIFCHRMGARVHFQIKPWSSHVEVYWSDGVEAYITPISNDQVEVAFLWYQGKIPKGAHLDQRLLDKFPELKQKLQEKTSLNDFKAIGPFRNYSKKIKHQNIFFVGDAYKFLDGITGEGISIGLKSADIISQNFEHFSWKNKWVIKFYYLNYSFWVYAALILSYFPRFRSLIFKFVRRYPRLFNKVLQLNDLTL